MSVKPAPDSPTVTQQDTSTRVMDSLYPSDGADTGLDIQRSPDRMSRSASSSSSLDPYYFGIGLSSESPAPPLPNTTPPFSTTPDSRLYPDPVTPVRNPGDIDRRGLVGVGELATPRWGRFETQRHELSLLATAHLDEAEEEEQVPDSPWTIEAVDGEGSDKEEMLEVSHPLRSRPSLNDESGGEEILYPRSHGVTAADLAQLPQPPAESLASSPPSAFSETPRRAKKRTSDEFERDQHGSLLSKRASTSGAALLEQPNVDTGSARKHKSLSSAGLSASSLRDKGKERRRESLTNRTARPDRHARQTSTGSSSGAGESTHSRRVHTTDFSHLPPSPSSSSIQQFLRQATSHSSPNVAQSHSASTVAHSLLRGTQEGWSGLDDEATAEALRKLDGLGGKTSRARQSLGTSSRPITPPHKSSIQWEGVARREDSDREGKVSGLGISVEASGDGSRKNPVTSEEERSSSSAPDKTPKRASARSSFTPKRASGSSTNYTSTPSSRDSISAATSVTSVSLNSGRQSSVKSKRNSAGSDNISVHSNSPVSTVPEGTEEDAVPPVPPLPKDLSSYRSPPATSAAIAFPPMPSAETKAQDPILERSSIDASASVKSSSTDFIVSNSTPAPRVEPAVMGSITESSPVAPKTPSKKWSFSGALNIKLSGSPSTSSSKGGFTLSPKGRTLRKSMSKEQATSPSAGSAKATWSPTHPDAMTSAASLASLSSTGSFATSRSPALRAEKTPDLSHAENSSSSNGHRNSSKLGISAQGPLSPSSSMRRGPSSKRLTPSSIPFFRRSSSQSMQIPPGATASFSPPLAPEMSSFSHAVDYSSSDYNPPSTSSKATPSKKASVLSLGLPSLLKSSSSRRSLHSDSKEGKELLKAKDAEKARNDKSDKEKNKKDDKDRSESRISVLMGRKRGKTVSSSEPAKVKPAATLPPMQISALPSSTAQRVANLKAASASTSVPSTPSSSRNSTSRLTHQTMSSLQKQSDSSLRSRNLLPTIAGSPSVAPQPPKETVAALSNSIAGGSKDTPTKIPRIASRTSSSNSPTMKNAAPPAAGSRISMNLNGTTIGPQPASPTPDASLNEFGVIEGAEEKPKKTVTVAASNRLSSIRASPSSSTSRVPRQVSAPTTQPRKPHRESMSFTGLRKSSTSSAVSSTQESQQSHQSTSHHRFSALSPSKGLKLLSPKISLTSPRVSTASVARGSQHSPTSSHQSLSTPSPVPVEDDETLGDKEMMGYIRRQQAKKLAAGASQEELDDLLRFPEPLPPGKPSSPAEVLQSSQSQHLSPYEKVEILDFPEVYCVGARSKKKAATPDDSHNNYGYDDDRGDYLVVNRDHLAYRYEIIDTLGKGSFGQVLHCRDHCTGESTAIKIIRNKKRFHHQALVEIKILDNLRKWDPDEKHHVIKMTEHFYFRNHLCIAMELLSINLYELIKANGFAGFSTGLIRRFTSQMLLSLSLMRHHRVVHCDLKPENVLLRHPAKSGLKVIDFGSSCFEHEKIYTYIQSRFYRSPEVILGMNYHMAIDMWSLGCILAELYTGFPIFPGENEQEQLSCIMEVLGIPDKEYINRSSRKRLFFEPNGAPRTVVNSKGRRRRPGSKSLAQVLRCNDEEFIDFVAKCLTWDPERRMKPQAALRHPFIAGAKASKAVNTLTKSTLSTSSLSGSRSRLVMETPKKSQIGAPTPLTARSARTSNIVPSTPGSSNVTMSASRTFRTQPVSFASSRTLNGLSSSK